MTHTARVVTSLGAVRFKPSPVPPTHPRLRRLRLAALPCHSLRSFPHQAAPLGGERTELRFSSTASKRTTRDTVSGRPLWIRGRNEIMGMFVNRVELIGNLGRDPEIRHTASGRKVATLNIATSESWKDAQSGEWRERTEWHRSRRRGRRTPPHDARQPWFLRPLRRRGRRRRTRRSQLRVRGVRRERRVRRRRTPDHDGLTVIPAREAARQCLASNAAWRREAAALRDHAALSHLSPAARQALLREAEAADRQADWWLTGAIEAS